MQPPKDLFKLTSIDEDGFRLDIIPGEVRGHFRKHRSRVQIILLVVFLTIPWIHVRGNQLILLNIPKKEFIFFGLIFKAHDAPLIFLLLAIGTLGLAFVTSVWGRIWCGWACPQTVFIDAVYRRIEILTEGKYIERRKLQLAEWTFSKLFKKSTKWLLFILVSTIFAHSFAAYFTGSYELIEMMKRSPSDNWNYFLIILFLTVLITFDFGWFREQFCVIMCPYGRIQSVLLESSSLAVVYDKQRGEPRRNIAAKTQPAGDCVSCNRCVEVCPTGIDIRSGLQMECISCAACIDACDEIMKKVCKPTGLISYKTLDGSKLRLTHFKTLTYGLMIIFTTLVLIFSLNTREPIEIAVLRGIESPYSQDIDLQGKIQIINHFRLHFVSQSNKNTLYKIQLSEGDQKNGMTLIVAQNELLVKSRDSETWHVFIKAPKNILPKNGKLDFHIQIQSNDGFSTTRDLIFLGPSK